MEDKISIAQPLLLAKTEQEPTTISRHADDDDEEGGGGGGGGSRDWRGRPAPLLGGWKAGAFFLGSNCLQSFATSGCTINLVIFMVRVMQQDNASAANAITTWLGTTFITSIIGGSMGDAYWGRLWTSILYQLLYVLGLVLFAMSASTIAHRVRESCAGAAHCHEASPSPSQVTLFYLALYIMGLGIASLTPNVVSLGADQFDSPKHKSSFISLHMASASVGMLLATSAVSYIENEGLWEMGFWISAGIGILGFLFFLAGVPSTRQFNAGTNPLFQIAHVILVAVRNCKTDLPPQDPDDFADDSNPAEKIPRLGLQRTPSLRWLDKATVSSWKRPSQYDACRESVCTVDEVEEVKSVCRLLPFWVCGMLLASVMAQKGTLFVLQGDTMDNIVWGDIEFPPSSMGLFSLAMVIMGAPFYALVIEPWAFSCRRQKRRVPSIERMGAGLGVAIMTFLVAAVTEGQRLRVAKERAAVARFVDGKEVSERVPMSIFWLVPQYILEGLTTVLFTCGHMEFNYAHSPQGMRSLTTAMSLCSFALANYLSSFLVKTVTSFTSWIPNDLNEGHLDYFYLLLDGLLLLTGVLFVGSSKWFLSTQAVEHHVLDDEGNRSAKSTSSSNSKSLPCSR